MKKTSVIILAAGNLGNYYWPRKFDEHPVWFANLGNNTNLNIITNIYDLKKFKINLVIDDLNQCDELKNYKFCSSVSKFINIENTQNILQTIFKALSFFKDEEEIIIQTITLIPDNQNKLKCGSIDVSKTQNRASWQTIEIDNHKNQQYALAGRIYAKVQDLNEFFIKNDIFDENKFKALCVYLLNKKNYGINNVEWIDSGHVETLSKSRIDFSFARSFNQINYNNIKGSVIKRSKNYEKLHSEFLHYSSLLPECSRFYPKVYNFEENKKEKLYELEMEYIAGFTLSEVFLFYDVSDFIWEDIFLKIKNVYKVHLKNSITDLNKCKNAFHDIYINKTILRIKEFEEYFSSQKNHDKFTSGISFILENDFYLNGTKFLSLKKTLEKLVNYLILLGNTNRVNPLNLIHGDMCFNNIIYDPFFGSLKIIDPRGKHSDGSSYYPNCYDIAKISHSVLGLYDSIISGLYNLDFKDNNYELNIYTPPNYKVVIDKFKKVFTIDNDLRVKELMLFASMLPLHIDSEERCLALLLRFFQISKDLSF